MVLCSITTKSDVIPEQKSQIYENVRVTKSTAKDDMIDVTIENSKKIRIYMHNSKNRDEPIDELYAFYTALSCKFASWAMNKIYDFIWRSPLSYQHAFPENETVTLEKLSPLDFESLLMTFVNNVEIHIEHMVRILVNFIDTNSNVTYYNDTSILEALEMFRIKLNYVSLKTEIPEVMGSPISNIIRLFLKDMTAFQRVLSINCSSVCSSGHNLDVNDYWITVTDNVHEPNDINQFFANIKNINLVSSDQTNCSCKLVLLEMFVAPPMDDEISLDIKNIDVAFDGNDSVKFKYIMDNIEMSYDPELIIRYQESVSAMIMSLVFSRVIDILFNKSLPKKIINNIIEIHQIISEDINAFPANLVDGFNVLNNFFTSNNPIIEDLINYYQSMTVVNNLNESKIRRKWKDIKYLNHLLKRISDNIYGIKCFQETYKRLHYKYEKSYDLPLTQRKMAFISGIIPTSTTKIDIYQRSCFLIQNIYSICYLALMDARGSFYILNGPDKLMLKKQSYIILSNIWNYFDIITNYRLHHGDVLKYAYTITPILMNLMRTFNNGLSILEIERVYSLIMTELNDVALNNCVFSKQNYLLFNNINLLEVVNKKQTDESFIQIVQLKYEGFNQIRLDDIEFLSIENNLYYNLDLFREQFFKKSKIYRLYEQIIRFYWKGDAKTVKNIYYDISGFLLNPQHFYAFYDLINKFYIAVVYYEIQKVFKKQFKLNIVEKHLDRLSKHLVDFESFECSQALNPLILKIKLLLMLPGDPAFDENMIMKIKQDIENELIKLNIVFEHKDWLLLVTDKLKNVMLRSSVKVLININKEIFYFLGYYNSLKNLFIMRQ